MKKKQYGFALPVSLLLLVVMTLMGAALVSITVGDIRANNEKDLNQQAFYAAESGISHAKKWMKDNTNTLMTSSQRNLKNDIKYCKATFFPNLNTENGFVVGRNSLNEVISTSDSVESKRLSNFSFEYFIGYSADNNGNNTSARKKPGTNKTYYTIYSCGCDGPKNTCRSQNNKIISLEAVVTIATQ